MVLHWIDLIKAYFGHEDRRIVLFKMRLHKTVPRFYHLLKYMLTSKKSIIAKCLRAHDTRKTFYSFPQIAEFFYDLRREGSTNFRISRSLRS